MGYQELQRGHYLSALRRLDEQYVSAEATPGAHNFLMWALNAMDPWGTRAWELTHAITGTDLRSAGPDISGTLKAAIAKHRLVVLQERHALPETRYFGARMIRWLAEAGATHLAFEHSVQFSFDEFKHSRVVRPSTEVYAFDPSRAALLRAARDAGLEMVAFDFPPEGQLKRMLARLAHQLPSDAPAINRERERHMAENIVRLILEPRADARVVVWTGEQHAMRRVPEGWWGPFMATHLAELTGEQPFCVGQEIVDWPELVQGPRLLNGAHAWAQERGLDAIVLHHRGSASAAPDWLRADAMTIRIRVDGAQLVQAIPRSEGEGAVPVAQQLTHGSSDLHLYAPPGEYVLRGLTGDDTLAWRRSMEITG
ncbi:MAG: hypothetical protein ACR2GA_04145 [Chloroflexota bacterium]